MVNRVRKQGFSIVELLAAIVSASLLAVVAGAVMYYTFQALHRHQGMVDAQRDATLALELIARVARETPANLASNSVAGGWLAFGRPDAPTRLFYVSGADLMYDPNTGAGGDEIELVRGRCIFFQPLVGSDGVNVTLTVDDGQSTPLPSMTRVAMFRN